jgi:hypothetical protein
MKNKPILLVIATIFAIAPIIVCADSTLSTGDSASSADISVGASSSSADTAAPSTGSSDTSAAPSTGDSDSSAGVMTPSTGDSTSSAGNTVSESISSSGGGVLSSSGGGRSYSSGGSALNYCTLISSPMKFGVENNSNEVRNLQTFLVNTQELDVNINGVYDMKTENAVKAFQAKYADTILAPWGLSNPSGIVSITTIKKINELACNRPLTLNASELAMINAYKQGQTSSAPTFENQEQNLPNQSINENSATPGPEMNTDENQDTNTATVGNASAFERFWNFLKSLF